MLLASTQKLYQGIAQGNIIADFTIPAFNLRLLTMDLAQAVFRVAKKNKATAFIFELARSEMEYTAQPPQEYADNILKAAEAENWQGPVFLQADHFKIKKEEFLASPKQALTDLEVLIERAIKAGFYNIDIDCSALDMASNIKQTAYFINYIRKLQPPGLEISVGGEVGEIGKANTTVSQLSQFLLGLEKELASYGDIKGISKVAVQTGTSHGKGGVIDWPNLKALAQEAKKHNLPGIVQHGASTLPKSEFSKFAQAGVCEIHLATELMDIVLGSPNFPKKIKEKIKTKRDIGPNKKEIDAMPQEIKNKLAQEVAKEFAFFFQELKVGNTQELIYKLFN
jgi:fructose/tagatose bisphosphate aldolase